MKENVQVYTTRTSRIPRVHWASNSTIQHPQQFTISIRENFCIFCTKYSKTSINSARTRGLRGSDNLPTLFKAQKTLHIIIKPGRDLDKK